MILLYSGSQIANGIQTDPNKSLGGYVSVTPIANGRLNNIFPPITRQSITDNLADTRLIVLVNAPVSLTNLTIWTVSGILSSYKIAATSPALDAKGNPVFETIYDSHSIPYQATLDTKEDIGQAIVISNVDPNQIIGIWIQRSLKLDAFSPLDGIVDPSIVCSDLEHLLTTDIPNQIDEGQLFIQWS